MTTQRPMLGRDAVGHGQLVPTGDPVGYRLSLGGQGYTELPLIATIAVGDQRYALCHDEMGILEVYPYYPEHDT